jgi:hypothetical protein
MNRRKFIGGSPPPRSNHRFPDDDSDGDVRDGHVESSHAVDRLVVHDDDSPTESRGSSTRSSRRAGGRTNLSTPNFAPRDSGQSRLRHQIPPTWEPYRSSDAEQVNAAADGFDEQHEKLSAEAVGLINKLGAEAGLVARPPPRSSYASVPSPRRSKQQELPKQQAATLWPPPLDDHRLKLLPDQQYLKALFAIRSNRFPVQPLRFGMQVSPRSRFKGLSRCHLENDGSDDAPPGGPWALEERVVELGDAANDDDEEAPVKRAWKIEESLWWPRRKWADSRDLYDTPECLRKALHADWQMACKGGGLEKFIVKHHKAAEPSSDEVVEHVLGALDDYNAVIYSIFDAYGMQGTGDFTHIQLNSYKNFCLDCEMV